MGCRVKLKVINSGISNGGEASKEVFKIITIMEMQIKTNLRHHLTPVRIAKIKNSDDSRCWLGCREGGTLLHSWWGFKLLQPVWKSVWWFLRKLDILLPEDPIISLLGIYLRDVPTYNKDTCSTMFIAALFIGARSWKNPDVYQLMNGYRKCGTFTQWSTTQLLETMTSWNS